MKKIYLVILVLALVSTNIILLKAKSEDSGNTFEDVLQKAAKAVLENDSKKDKKAEAIETGQVAFKVKKINLWLKDKYAKDKKKLKEFAEISLPGKFYFPPKEIRIIEKKDIDRSTIENTVASVFSANRAGDLDWIVKNFVDKDQEKVKKLFEKKKILDEINWMLKKLWQSICLGR